MSAGQFALANSLASPGLCLGSLALGGKGPFGALFRSGHHPGSSPVPLPFDTDDVVSALGSFCALNQRRFEPELLLRQSPPPYTSDSIIAAARSLGFRIKRREVGAEAVMALGSPSLVVLLEPEGLDGPDGNPPGDESLPKSPRHRPALAVQAEADRVVLFRAGANTPVSLTPGQFQEVYAGTAFQLSLKAVNPSDPDRDTRAPVVFGFRWFVPELLKYGHVWRDVQIASLVIQLLALATPLFT